MGLEVRHIDQGRHIMCADREGRWQLGRIFGVGSGRCSLPSGGAEEEDGRPYWPKYDMVWAVTRLRGDGRTGL